MGTEYSKNEIDVWKPIEDSVLSEILRTGEVLIENEELEEFIEGDGFFRVIIKLYWFTLKINI